MLKFRHNGVGGGDLEGCYAEYTFHVRDEIVGWNAVTVTRLANYGADWYSAGKGAAPVAARTLMNPAWSLSDVVCQDLGVTNGIKVTVPTAFAGTRAGAAPSPSVCAEVRHRADPGEVPPLWWNFLNWGSDEDFDGNDLDGAFGNAVLAVMNDFIGSLSNVAMGGAVDWAFVGVSRAAGTPAQLLAVRTKRAELRAAIAATRRATAITGTHQASEIRQEIASQRDRRASQ